MEVQLKRRDDVFAMPNEKLAFALAVAGVKFATPDEGGPAVNSYSRGFFNQERFKQRGESRFAGMSITDAAIHCFNKRIPGDVTYMFHRSADSEEFIRAWDSMAQERRNADAENRAPGMPTISPTAMAQVLFVAANSVDEFKTAPFLNRELQVASTMAGGVTHRAPKMNNGEAVGEIVTEERAGMVWCIFGKNVREHLKV